MLFSARSYDGKWITEGLGAREFTPQVSKCIHAVMGGHLDACLNWCKSIPDPTKIKDSGSFVSMILLAELRKWIHRMWWTVSQYAIPGHRLFGVR
jgi:hypothetical protein